MYVIGVSPEEKSEQVDLNHRHAGYKPAALPLSYVPVCFSDQALVIRISNNLFPQGELVLVWESTYGTHWLYPIRS